MPDNVIKEIEEYLKERMSEQQGTPPAGVVEQAPQEWITEAMAAARWESVIADLRDHEWVSKRRLAPLAEVLRSHPRLGLLWPFTSMATLCLSRATRYTYTRDCPRTDAIEEGIFRVSGPRYCMARPVSPAGHRRFWPEYERHGEGDIAATVRLLEENLPEGCGPAIVGEADDLCRYLGLPLPDAWLDTVTEELYDSIHDNPEAIPAVLARGANVNAGFPGYTPLMVAVMEGKLTAVRLLLEGGADVHRQTLGGDTALRLALLQEDDYPEVALLLRQATDS